MMVTKHRHARGFTMVELIIVIAILGVLSAFALPRFGNFTTNAKTAAREGIVSTLNVAIGIAHAQWIANGATASVTLDGSPVAITMNNEGYPDIPTTYNSTASCQNLVNALLTNVSGLTVGYSSDNSACTINNSNWSSPVGLTANIAN